jgi:hypothetical protein
VSFLFTDVVGSTRRGTLTARSHNLPIQLTSFVGREALVAGRVQTVLDDRLVTVVADGGASKTRLALIGHSGCCVMGGGPRKSPSVLGGYGCLTSVSARPGGLREGAEYLLDDDAGGDRGR